MKIKRLTFLAILSLIYAVQAFASDYDIYKQKGDNSPKWDSYVESAFSAFDSGNLGPAEMFLQRAVARGCNDGLVYMKIALFNEANKNYKAAVNYTKKAAKLLPSQYPDHQLTRDLDQTLGRILFLNDNKKEADHYLRAAVAKDEDFTSLYFLGQLERERGNLSKAADFFERSLRTKYPEGASPTIGILIMTELGKCYYELKNFDTSLTWWDRILKLEPSNQVAVSFKEKIQQQKFNEQEKKMIEEIVK